MRERWKAAREGDEIVSETVRLQWAGAHRRKSRVTVFLLKNEPTSVMCVACLRTFGSKAKGNRVLKGRISGTYTTRNRVSNPWPGWVPPKGGRRSEPTSCATLGDELWIAEKFQSNSVIAGSPRNSFWTSGMYTSGGRALDETRVLRDTYFNQTPNTRD